MDHGGRRQEDVLKQEHPDDILKKIRAAGIASPDGDAGKRVQYSEIQRESRLAAIGSEK